MGVMTDLFTDIANALRGKKGTVAPIPAADFISEIANLPLGDPKPSVGILQTEWDVNGYPTKYEVYGITTLTENYFRYSLNTANRNVQTVVFDLNLISLGDNAFVGCNALTNITLPNTVTTLGLWVFANCSGLTSITIPNNVTTLGGGAFYNSGLTSITIPNSVITAGNSSFPPFELCTHLTTAVLESGMTKIPDYLFYKAINLTAVTIPETVTTLGLWAFARCTSLTNVVLPSNLTTISNFAFYACESLTVITIPKTVVTAGSSDAPLFELCINLATAVLESGMIKVPDYLFKLAGKLTSITIPNTVTEIGISAFNSNPLLTSITVPPSVSIVGAAAFLGCTGLTSITLGGVGYPVTSIATSTAAFEGCTGLTSITVYTTGGAALSGAPWGATNATITYLSA